MAEEPPNRWQGKANVKIPNYTADQIWPLMSDYCNLHKYLNIIDTCRLAGGTLGEPGCVRYCAGAGIPTADGSVGKVSWANEKLLEIDSLKRFFRYQITENNIGFTNYEGNMKVFPVEGDGKEKGCEIEWSFVSDPGDGWELGLFVFHLDSNLNVMAKKMQEALLKG